MIIPTLDFYTHIYIQIFHRMWVIGGDMKGYRGTGIQRYRYTGIQGYRDLQGYRNTGLQGYRDTGSAACRTTETQIYRIRGM